MDYRSPVFSLERELETLEAELARLRALPPAKPKPAPKKSKRARGVEERETHALRRQLKKVSAQIQERSLLLGVRDLTPREIAAGKSMKRIAAACLGIAAFVMCGSLVMAASHRFVWTETTCTLGEDAEGVWVASYTAGDGTTQTFGASRTKTGTMRCWVPGPKGLGSVGRFERPTRSVIPLRDRISPFGPIFAGIFAFLAALMFVTNYFDEKKRRNCEIEPDDFPSAD